MPAKKKKGGKAKAPSDRPVATNRRARHDYEILDTYEAGISLLGPEVKSLRDGRANLREAFAVIRRGEVWLQKMHVSPYEPASRGNPADPTRDRKLLLHKGEISKLIGRVAERGNTLVPLSVYFKDGRAKVELALARGRHTYDKRAALKKKEDEATARRALRSRGGRAPALRPRLLVAVGILLIALHRLRRRAAGGRGGGGAATRPGKLQPLGGEQLSDEPYRPDRRDYMAFRRAWPDVLEPNYLPFMVHRRAGDPVKGDLLLFCRWPDDAMPLQVYIDVPPIPSRSRTSSIR